MDATGATAERALPSSSPRAAASVLAALLLLAGCVGAEARLFYRQQRAGTQAMPQPVHTAVNIAFDSVQVEEGGPQRTIRFTDNWHTLRENLLDPGDAIQDVSEWRRAIREGTVEERRYAKGWRESFRRQLVGLPAVPNWFHHFFLGSGLNFRLSVEWFEAQGVGYPSALLLGLVTTTAAELVNEAVELRETSPDEAIADVFLFDLGSKLLFSVEPFARFMSEEMRLCNWGFLPMLGLERGRIRNAGANYVMKPPLPWLDNPRGFVFVGMTTLLGLSWDGLAGGYNLSLGVGGTSLSFSADDPDWRLSGGIFVDRDDSLLASLIFNGSEGLAVRLNVYPLPGLGIDLGGYWLAPAFYLGVADDGEVSAGITCTWSGVGLSN